ncbi:hypothetical protein BB561_003923 [Smittium simulii]|uniref:Uncharacterized protein n=1 Tax=Smittium simulii TaxID=133385 RepID=A0A2T9YJ00_9FUNG|nr:hypothetical protein BB561_003923 [Smittium simulii]
MLRIDILLIFFSLQINFTLASSFGIEELGNKLDSKIPNYNYAANQLNKELPPNNYNYNAAQSSYAPTQIKYLCTSSTQLRTGEKSKTYDSYYYKNTTQNGYYYNQTKTELICGLETEIISLGNKTHACIDIFYPKSVRFFNPNGRRAFYIPIKTIFDSFITASLIDISALSDTNSLDTRRSKKKTKLRSISESVSTKALKEFIIANTCILTTPDIPELNNTKCVIEEINDNLKLVNEFTLGVNTYKLASSRNVNTANVIIELTQK